MVIIDAEKYINEANCQLSDKRNYKTLEEDLTPQHSNLVNDTIDRFKKENLFSKALGGELKLVNPKPEKRFLFHPRYIKKTTKEDQ